MSKSEDARSSGCQSRQESYSILQSEHDGSLGARFGKLKEATPLQCPQIDRGTAERQA